MEAYGRAFQKATRDFVNAHVKGYAERYPQKPELETFKEAQAQLASLRYDREEVRASIEKIYCFVCGCDPQKLQASMVNRYLESFLREWDRKRTLEGFLEEVRVVCTLAVILDLGGALAKYTGADPKKQGESLVWLLDSKAKERM